MGAAAGGEPGHAAAAAFALRHDLARHARQSTPRGRAGLFGVRRAADGVCGLGRADRHRRAAAGQPDGLRLAQLHVVAGVGRTDRHGGDRRPGQCAGSDLRCGGLSADGRGLQERDAALDAADGARGCGDRDAGPGRLRPLAGVAVAGGAGAGPAGPGPQGRGGGGGGVAGAAGGAPGGGGTRELVRRFGGLAATDGVSLDVAPGELHALIGPNGAGKTTLINLLSGELRPDGGAVTLGAADVSRATVQERVALGMLRSYQVTSVFDSYTVLENACLAALRKRRRGLSAWTALRDCADVVEAAREALSACRLDAAAEAPVESLAYGQRRQLEIAMALAGQPAATRSSWWNTT
ncbi:hypothetical protein G6F22_014179 [Rhizopus arrhizus]|nr:hypothetical protein G6F22_014179 [Rhizopus arrhizus]